MPNTSDFIKTSINIGIAVLVISLAFTVVVYRFWSNFEWPSHYNGETLTWLKYSNRFYSDFFAVFAIAILFWSHGRIGKTLFVSILFIFFFTYFIQSNSFRLSGRFLPSIALENIQHANFLDTKKLILEAFAWLFLFTASLLICHKVAPNNVSNLSKACLFITLICLAGICKNDKFLWNQTEFDTRASFYKNRYDIRIGHDSPLSELIKTLKDYGNFLKSGETSSSNLKKLISPQVATFAENYYQSALSSVSKKYPLIRSHQQSLPLSTIGLTQKSTENLNLIVFFVEGLSARIIQPYSELFPGISSNIETFSQESLIFENYYNHTFATYRGLSGQLCSIYPIHKLLDKTNYYCLPHALKNLGYDTRFLMSQRNDKTELDSVFSIAGFSQIDNFSTINHLLNISKSNRTNELYVSDKQLIEALVLRLIEREQNDTPFFFGLYNIETHTGFKLGKDGKSYPSKLTPKSFLLDTFYNFDQAFGEFWTFFKNSKLRNNTIIVLTSDHATWPSTEYTRLAKDSTAWSGKFSDEIPLLIYHPELQVSKKLNANNASSLDFTPSILHLMGATPEKSPFLGKSIFSKKNTPFTPIISGPIVNFANHKTENGFWQTLTPSQIATKNSKKKSDLAQDRYQFIQFQQELERQNLLWPKNATNDNQ